jgi:hypothetical protein
MRIKQTIGVIAVLSATIGAGVAIGSGTAHSTVTVKTVSVPGPVRTAVVPVPGPTVTETETAAPPTPATALDFTGHGTEVTPAFSVPTSGDYIVTWTFNGNGDGYGNAGNFIAGLTDSSVLAFSLPNDIASSGSGSTEVTGDTGTDSLNVQSEDGSTWTIKVIAAS